MTHFATTILGRLLEPALTLRLTLTLLHFLWQGALLGLVAFAADRALQRASSRVRYAIFVCVLTLMVASLPATFLLIDAGKTRSELAAAPAPTAAPVVVTSTSPAPISRPVGTTSLRAASVPATVDAPIADLVPGDAFTAPRPTAKEPPTEFLEPFAGPVTAAYLAGMLLMLARLAIALEGGRRLRSAATPIPDGPIAELVRRQATQLGLKTAPLVAWCSRISVPVVVGIVRPMILLPGALATGFDPSQLEALLTHELAHIRRFDPLVNLLQRLIEVALFFHPAVWYVSRFVSAERENACDDLVLSAGWPAVRYAQALLQMAESCATTRGISLDSNAALAASGGGASQLKRRVLRLLEIDDAPKVRFSRGGVMLLACAVAFLFLVPTLTRAVGKKAPAQAAPTEKGAEEEHSQALSRVLAAWKERQDKVKSFHFKWDTRVTIPKGYEIPRQFLLAGLATRFVDLDGDREIEITIPQSDWWGEGTERFRDDFTMLNFAGANRWTQAARTRFIQDGSRYSRLEVPVNSKELPWISIWRMPAAGAGDAVLKQRMVDFLPLRLALRPLNEPPYDFASFLYCASAWTAKNARVTSENAVIGDMHCIKLQQDQGDHHEACWVDPKRDYVVVFWERREGDSPTKSIVIEYEQDREQGWLPSRWTMDVPGGQFGQPATIQATVTGYEINRPFRENPFVSSSSAGTEVYDVTVERTALDLKNASAGKETAEARKTLDAIASAWARRRAGIRSFKLTWRTTSPVRGTSNHMLSVDGNRFAWAYLLQRKLPPPSPRARKAGEGPDRKFGYLVDEARLVFDGTNTTRLGISHDDGVGQPRVFMYSGLHENDKDNQGDRNLLFALLPRDPVFAPFDLSKFKVVPGGGRIDGISCVILTSEVGGGGGGQEDYWLDPARDYLVLREHRASNGRDVLRIDMTYRHDPQFGWIPLRWRDAVAGAGGSAFGANSGSVDQASINQPIPESEFKMEIPKGAQVIDMRKGGGATNNKDLKRPGKTTADEKVSAAVPPAVGRLTGPAPSAAGPTLRGEVHGIDGKPIVGATVMIWAAGVKSGYSTYCPGCYADCGKRAATDSHGAFAISHVSPDLRFQLLVVRDGFAPKFVNKVDPFEGAIAASLKRRATPDDPSQAVRGRVVGPTGAPLSGAVVESEWVSFLDANGKLRGWGGDVEGLDPMAVTNDQGEFELAYSKPAVKMTMKVHARGMAPRWFQEIPTGAERHTMALSRGATIRGRLTQFGKPIGHTEMGLVFRNRSSDGFFREERIGTEPDGSFQFVNVPAPGTWYVYAKMESIVRLGATLAVEARTERDDDVVDVGAIEIRPGHRMRGRVVLSDGKLIPDGMKMSISTGRAWDSQTAALGPDGRFEFDSLPTDDYSINPAVKGYRFSDKNPNLAWSVEGVIDRDIDDFVIVLDPGRENFEGRYTGKFRGQPLRSAPQP
jgi:beta-lactamase regulating signal transducer with metallopeptidase domain